VDHASFNLLAAAAGIAIVLASLTVHEAAHAWTAEQLGDSTARRLGRVSLNPLVHIDPIGTVLLPLIAVLSNFPLIGWAKPVPVDMRQLAHPRRDFAVIAAAGPLSNIGLAVIAAVLVRFAGETSGTERFLVGFLQTNVFLAVFNLLPVPPLDGSRVLLSILPLSLARAFVRFERVGLLVVLLVVLNTPILPVLVGPVVRFIVGLAS
jgi:Zn-dependent protease